MSKSQEPSSEIPYEVQIEIFIRLPVKSLMRFKSVSKLLSSFICSQYFTDRFLKVSSSPLRIYMRQDFGKNKLVLSASSSPESDFLVDQDLTNPAFEGYSVSQVYHGLMCLVNGPSAKIYNTCTRQLVILPDIEESKLIAEDRVRKRIMYHIGHDPVHNQYKVVCTISVISVPRRDDRTEIWVFVLGGNDSSPWRKISSPFKCYPLTQGLTINGRLYYIAWVRLLPLVLVIFDISSEEISILQEPEYQAFWPNNLIEYSGKVALLRYSYLEDEGVIDLWVMEDEEKSSWSKKTLVLHPSQRDIISGIRLRFKGTTRNGEVIFVPRHTMCIPPTLFHVILYNLQKNLVRIVEIKETSNHSLNKVMEVIGFDDVENLMYL